MHEAKATNLCWKLDRLAEVVADPDDALDAPLPQPARSTPVASRPATVWGIPSFMGAGFTPARVTAT
jgi:hypothetical protein